MSLNDSEIRMLGAMGIVETANYLISRGLLDNEEAFNWAKYGLELLQLSLDDYQYALTKIAVPANGMMTRDYRGFSDEISDC